MTSNCARPITACFTKSAFVALASLTLLSASALSSPARAGEVPTFAVDASWPKALPNNWILG